MLISRSSFLIQGKWAREEGVFTMSGTLQLSLLGFPFNSFEVQWVLVLKMNLGWLLRLMQAVRFCVLDDADPVLKCTYLDCSRF